MNFRLSLILWLLPALCTKLYGQDPASEKLFFGLSVGQTTTTFVGSEIDFRLDPYYSPGAYFKSRKGIVITAQAKLTFAKYLFIRPSLSYIQKGAEEMKSSAIYNFKSNLAYLAVPLILGVQPLNFDNIRYFNLYIEGGITPNFQVSRTNDNLQKGFAGTPDVKKTVLSYQVGAGLEFRITKNIILSGNYTYFMDAMPFFTAFKTNSRYAYNQGTSISGGVMIDMSVFNKD